MLINTFNVLDELGFRLTNLIIFLFYSNLDLKSHDKIFVCSDVSQLSYTLLEQMTLDQK